jgi:hypothetical protein
LDQKGVSAHGKARNDKEVKWLTLNAQILNAWRASSRARAAMILYKAGIAVSKSKCFLSVD